MWKKIGCQTLNAGLKNACSDQSSHSVYIAGKRGILTGGKPSPNNVAIVHHASDGLVDNKETMQINN